MAAALLHLKNGHQYRNAQSRILITLHQFSLHPYGNDLLSQELVQRTSLVECSTSRRFEGRLAPCRRRSPACRQNKIEVPNFFYGFTQHVGCCKGIRPGKFSVGDEIRFVRSHVKTFPQYVGCARRTHRQRCDLAAALIFDLKSEFERDLVLKIKDSRELARFTVPSSFITCPEIFEVSGTCFTRTIELCINLSRIFFWLR